MRFSIARWLDYALPVLGNKGMGDEGAGKQQNF